MVRRHFEKPDAAEIEKIKTEIADYLRFRNGLAHFLDEHFKTVCTQKCYQNRLSACCSRDGIITFFADTAINVLLSEKQNLDRMEHAISNPANEFKCIYLSDTGCLWQIKPVVCEFFLCDEAENKAFNGNPEALKQWEEFKSGKQTFTWPDRPVLFEHIESYFMERGCRSPLMYLHNSPGLVRIRRIRDAKL